MNLQTMVDTLKEVRAPEVPPDQKRRSPQGARPGAVPSTAPILLFPVASVSP